MALRFVPIERKHTHDSTISLNTKFCSICRHFAEIPMSNYGPPFRPPSFGGLGWTFVVETGANRNVVRTFLVDFYTHNRSILRHLATIYNATDRETDRQTINWRPYTTSKMFMILLGTKRPAKAKAWGRLLITIGP